MGLRRWRERRRAGQTTTGYCGTCGPARWLFAGGSPRWYCWRVDLLDRAVEEKTRRIEWVCIHADIHPHVYNDINVLLQETPIQAPFREPRLYRSAPGPVCLGMPGLHGRLHISRDAPTQVDAIRRDFAYRHRARPAQPTAR